jgi:hypothetical protein
MTKQKLRGRTWRLILDTSVANPLLSPRQLAPILGLSEGMLASVMKSDAFREKRTEMILERYGGQIAEIRGKLFDVTGDLLDEIKSRIHNQTEPISDQMMLKLLELLTPHTAEKLSDAQGQQPGGVSPGVNITLNLEDLNRGQRRLEERSQTIDVTPYADNHIRKLPQS